MLSQTETLLCQEWARDGPRLNDTNHQCIWQEACSYFSQSWYTHTWTLFSRKKAFSCYILSIMDHRWGEIHRRHLTLTEVKFIENSTNFTEELNCAICTLKMHNFNFAGCLLWNAPLPANRLRNFHNQAWMIHTCLFTELPGSLISRRLDLSIAWHGR